MALKPIARFLVSFAVALSGCSGDPSSSPSSSSKGFAEKRQAEAVTARAFSSNRALDREALYPEAHGVVLGQGWNSVTESPVPSVCIRFTPSADEYQDKKVTVRRIMDNETLGTFLKITARANVKGKLPDGSGGKANSSMRAEHQLDIVTSEINYLVSAETLNGRRFVAPLRTNKESKESSGRIEFSEDALELLKRKDAVGFESLCGDSFISSIEDGGRLNALFRFRSKDRTERTELEHDSGAEGKFLGVGGGGGINILARLTKKAESKSNEIEFFQQGGNGGKLPIDEVTLNAIIEDFPNSTKPPPPNSESDADGLTAKGGAKPFKMTVTSYRALPDFKFNLRNSIDSSLEERLARYYLRLLSAQNEILSMYRDNSFARNYEGTNASYTWDLHEAVGFPPDLISDKRQKIGAKIREVAEHLRALENRRECYRTDNQKIGPKAVACVANDKGFTKEIPTDDLQEYADLPVPIDSIPPTILSSLRSKDTTDLQRKEGYAQLRWYFWIYRTDKVRCEVQDDCLSRDDKRRYLDQFLLGLRVSSDNQRELERIARDDCMKITFGDTVKSTLGISARELTGRVASSDGNQPSIAYLQGATMLQGIDRKQSCAEVDKLRRSVAANSIYVQKGDFITARVDMTTNIPSRVLIHRAPVVKGIVMPRDEQWERVMHFPLPYEEHFPRDVDYIYYFMPQHSWCGEPWTNYGSPAVSNCPAERHETTLRSEALLPPYRNLRMVFQLAEHVGAVNVITEYMGLP